MRTGLYLGTAWKAGLLLWSLIILEGTHATHAGIIFETTSPYHHIRVIDQNGLRTLSFDNSSESMMSLMNPLQGHFEYTEYFHMPWLWKEDITRVLMIGLGGGSTQRAFQYYYPDVKVETVELDPVVLQVARRFFFFRETTNQIVHLSDGRIFLRRSQQQYDVIVMDAYTSSRYGSFIPYSLVTREFFELAYRHLTENGVFAYNVIGSLTGYRMDILKAMYRTLRSVFPQIYLFPAASSQNVVLMAIKSAEGLTKPQLEWRAAQLARSGRVRMPAFYDRVKACQFQGPPYWTSAPILTDDFAPVDGLLRTAR